MVITKAKNATSKNVASPDVKLTCGEGKLEDAAAFQAATEKLAVQVGMSGEKGARFGASAIRTGNAPTFTKPADLKGNATSYKEKMIFNYETKQFFEKNKNDWEAINRHIFSIVLAVCDEGMLERLEGQNGFNDAETSIVATKNGVALLRMVKLICHCRDEPKENTMTLVLFDIKLMTAAMPGNAR